MLKGFLPRLIVMMVAPMLLLGVLLTAHSLSTQLTDLRQSLHDRGTQLASNLAPACEYGVMSGNVAILDELLRSASLANDVVSIRVQDHQGRELASIQRRNPGPEEPLERFRATIEHIEISLDDFAQQYGAQNHHLGEVEVVLTQRNMIERRYQMIRHSLMIGVAGILLSCALAWRLSKGFRQPVRALSRAVKHFGAGKLDERVQCTSPGELGVLEHGFNRMAEAIESAQEHLQERIRHATSQLRHQASHDTLTGLINRAEFERRVALAITNAQMHHATHAIGYLDLDQFKIVNDTCGHAAGDALLRQLSMLLEQQVPKGAILARLGGDEFGLLMEHTPIEAASQLAGNLLDTINRFRFTWEGKSFGVGASIGLAAINAETANLHQVLAHADAACFSAKDSGRNRIQIHQASDTEIQRRQGEMHWVGRINHALEQGQLQLFHQPIMDILHQAPIDHIEVLLRIMDSHGTLITPMAFIPAAERYNLMPTLDRWVISHVFEQLGTWQQQGHAMPTTCSINLSGMSLGDPELFDFILTHLEQHALPAERICFEITETAAIVNLPQAVDLMQRLRKLGCRFSLDDFGSGVSSMGYLKQLPVDYVKIDGVFVRDIAHDPISRAMVASINEISHLMGLKTIAEYVDTVEVLDILQALRVDFAQGYWIAAPRPLSEFSTKRPINPSIREADTAS
ncbi:diguanylate cyclase (GGDEF)-like protein [Chitinivorax tropicus]|uniref:Diguanylate cyclase (GGDEF)-like protein n=1 Tax=Chitinivorax tropicus TaxID=714531 RepID=A0A840MJM6_9PROT|nr:EAL domain-containing protein [Chitinivorax tropicus]MBB5016892.1 diguanylate cyclase (GGDEF)-like protein [Chitinivorax tropicus]